MPPTMADGSNTSAPMRAWTPGEWEVLTVVAETKGWAYALRYCERLLREAQPFMD